MKQSASGAELVDYLSVSEHLCPQCGGSLIRTPRRLIDRLWSLLVPVHRYRCSRYVCQWTGNLRVDRSATDTITTDMQ